MTRELTAQVRQIEPGHQVLEIRVNSRIVATVRPMSDGIMITSSLLRSEAIITMDSDESPTAMHIRLLP